MAKLLKKSAQVSLRADGGLRLGVVADTHSMPNEQGLTHLAAQRPEVLLHAGDIGDLQVLTRLQQIAPVLAVRGNIDTRAPEVPDVLTIDVVDERGQRALRLLLLHIAVTGPRIRGDIAKLARSEGASLIVCGHSHVPFIGQERALTVFNPGSIGPKRFTLPILFGSIEITRSGVTLHHFDAESGQRWLPG